jgi:PKHD-type hydroxylase
MLLQLEDVLSPQVLSDLVARVPQQGRSTIPPHDGAAESPRELRAILVDGLRAHPLFMLGVQPRRYSWPVVRQLDPEGRTARIETAMYGDLRADVSVTVFLSDPSSYEGGELWLDTGFGEEPYKQRAGACLIYPASARQRTAKVTAGAAVVGELCVQSRIREAERRQIIYDVGCSRRYLELFGGGREADVAKLATCEETLIRLWSEA